MIFDDASRKAPFAGSADGEPGTDVEMIDSSAGSDADTPPPGLSLDSCLAVVHRYRWLILLAALGGTVAGLFLAMMRPAIFEARATIVMNRPTGSPAAPAAAGQALRALFTNQGVAAQVLQETGLDRPPHNLAPGTFVVENLAIDELVPGSMLVVRVRAADPDLAVKACNRLIALVTQLEGRVGAEEGVAGEDYIKQQLDSSRQKLDELESRLLDFKSRAQVDLRREDVRALLDSRRALIDLEMRLAAERGHLAAAESELVRRSNRSQAHVVQGRQGSSKGTSPADAGTANDSSASGQGIVAEPTDTGVGEVYRTLDYEAASSRVRLAGLESRRRELVTTLGIAKPTLRQLTELYRNELEEARLQAEYDVSAKVYQDLLTRYEQVRIQAASQGAGTKLIDTAIAATKVSRSLTTIAITLGGIAGFGGGILLAFVLEFLRAHRGTAPSAVTR